MTGIASLLMANNGVNLLYCMLALPAALSLIVLLLHNKSYILPAGLFLVGVTANLALSWGVFSLADFTLLIPWAGFDINLAFRVYDFSRLMILATGAIVFLVGLYSVSFLRRRSGAGLFFFYYLLTAAMVNGALLSNNLIVLLFFWEGLLATLFGFLALLNKRNGRAAVKALVLNGTADLLLMLGIAITCQQAGTAMMDTISDLPLEGPGLLGFLCVMAGAVGKAGAMPFHSWIPEAAEDAPLPFLALLPAALEKMLGVYLLVRVTMDFYLLQPGSSLSMIIMAVGAATIVFAVCMALIQKEMKRLLSYHAISQVGYMILGIGTALPVGIVGGLFHLLNNAVYKCCLLLTAGSVEKATGTTDLRQISGLGRLMPITGICFVIAALSISGVPPFNGFFSKELVFDAALESGMVFYIAAVVGAFFTAASFLKLGHAAFFGPTRLPEGLERKHIHESPGAMLLPMVFLAGLCVFFGLVNSLPLSYIQPLLGERLAGADFSGWPHSITLVAISAVVLLLAALNHVAGYRVTGEGLKAADHIHYAPGFRQIYNCAEKHYFDPYDLLMSLMMVFAWLCFCVDRAVNWIYDVFFVRLAKFVTTSLRNFNTGAISAYLAWSFTGMSFLVLLFLLLI